MLNVKVKYDKLAPPDVSEDSSSFFIIRLELPSKEKNQTDILFEGKKRFFIQVFFLKRMQPHTDLYYTRANTYTRQTKYRYTLETYREDRCTHQLTQKTLHKRKITMRSQRSFVLSTSTFYCCLRRPPLLARPTPEQGSHSKDTKVGRSTIARML